MKIFGIGLSKTGTTSLAVALETLGFNARHAVSSLDEIDDVDAVTDEMATIYQRLDEEYPGSKFILTVRDEASWLRSCRHHFRQPVPADHPIHDVLMALYGTTVFEREKFLAGYRRHSEAVREYFRGRPDDLLVLDLVSGGEGYRELCAFLECPMPDAAEFPKENVSRSWRRIWRKLRDGRWGSRRRTAHPFLEAHVPTLRGTWRYSGMIGTENWATQVQKMWKRTRRLGGRLLLAGVLACATMLAAAGATEPETHQPVKCPGEYGGHLQGLDVDGQGFVYWSMTVAIVKTNADGELVCRVDAPSHQGDLTCREGWVYVAVNLGLFNDPEERADSWVYVYDAADLSLLEKHPLGDVVYGAGGIAHDGEHFLVVGGLPDDRQVNHVYEYDEGFRLLAHHEIASGHTHLGIQTATFADGHWWFGCYGRPPQLLKVDRDFQMAGRYTFDASLGVAPLGDGRFLLGRGKCTDGTCQGWAVVGHSDAESGLRLDD